ncbi:MAG TPA: cupredoxin domain-containing protein [Candidatus Rubrimentiphilum sp.]|nr:cupredoxin domain-containing protein [Candidatus Rubrimentiphilum sp.]
MKKSLSLALMLAFMSPLAAWSHPSIDVVASNWKFTPDTITVHLNEPTTLRLTSSEGVHGIESADLGIPKTIIPPQRFVTVAFVPKKLGTYKVYCAVICGAGHPNMILIVKVVQ